MPVLPCVPGRRGGGGPAVGAGHRHRDPPESNGVPASGTVLRRLRDGHVRRGAAGLPRGLRHLRAGAERAVLLSCYGNVPAERSARLIGMLTGEDVSPGWVDKAVARVNARLQAGGFDEALAAALAAEDLLAADETPVNVLDKTPPRPGSGRGGRSG